MKLYISTKFQKIIIFIFTFITEIILPYFLILENEHVRSLKAFSKIDQSAIFLLIFFWIFISYVRGRYSQIKSSNILKNLILEFKELLIVSTFATIVLYFSLIIIITYVIKYFWLWRFYVQFIESIYFNISNFIIC